MYTYYYEYIIFLCATQNVNVIATYQQHAQAMWQALQVANQTDRILAVGHLTAFCNGIDGRNNINYYYGWDKKV